jgi:hypothetical protein
MEQQYHKAWTDKVSFEDIKYTTMEAMLLT